MPQRFGQADDYSSTFAYLANQAHMDMERRADEADRKREEDQAARDDLMFEKFQQGKISGGDILAYIRRRIRETGYDKAQQANWRKALIQYEGAIADQRAEADYLRTGDESALIDHYRQRQGGLAKNSPEWQELDKRVLDLVDKRDSDHLNRGAQRIIDAIESGDATLRDLVQFYARQKHNLRPGSALMDTVDRALSEARKALREQTFDTQMARIDHQLASHQITPEQAGQAKLELLNASPLRTSDPARYFQLIDDANRLKFSPDPAALAKLEYELKIGTITPEQYETALYGMAERIMRWDPEAAWNLRRQGAEAVTSGQGTKLPYQQYLGEGGTFKWISQLDGSAFASRNCVFASGAMLAYAMGNRGLSGGDLRYLSEDRVGGTSYEQLQYALEKVGITGTQVKSGIAFEDFKRRIANGSPAALSGLLGNLPDQLNIWNLSGATGHSVFIAKYDPKKDAFLVLDPAVSRRSNPNYKGQWWDADIVQNYGWGPAIGGQSRYGSVMFAPRGTIDPKSPVPDNIRWIDVDTPPKLPDTPKSYHGLTEPGNRDRSDGIVSAAERRARREERQGRRRRTDRAPDGTRTDESLVDPSIDTEEEADADLARREELLNRIAMMSDAYNQGRRTVMIGGEEWPVTDEVMGVMDRQALDLMDGMVKLERAKGNFDGAEEFINRRAAYIDGIQQRNTLETNVAFNELVRTINDDLAMAAFDQDPASAAARAQKWGDAVREFAKKARRGTVEPGGGQPPAPEEPTEKPPRTGEDEGTDQTPTPDLPKPKAHPELEDITPQGIAEIDALAGVLDLIGDPDIPIEEKRQALKDLQSGLRSADNGIDFTLPGDFLKPGSEWGIVKDPSTETGDDLGRLLAGIATESNTRGALARGEADLALVNGDLRPVPIKTRNVVDPATGAITPVPTLDVSAYTDQQADELPQVVVKTADGPRLVYAVPEQVQYGSFLAVKNAAAFRDKGWQNGYKLSDKDIADLGYDGIQRFLAQGVLGKEPWMVDSITTPPVKLGSGVVAGRTWYKDPDTWWWHTGKLPVSGVPSPSATNPRTLLPRLTDWIGWDPTTNSPSVTWSGTSRGVPAPTMANVTAQDAQRMMDNGEMSHLLTGMFRDETGRISTDPKYATKYTYIPPTPRPDSRVGGPGHRPTATGRADDAVAQPDKPQPDIRGGFGFGSSWGGESETPMQPGTRGSGSFGGPSADPFAKVVGPEAVQGMFGGGGMEIEMMQRLGIKPPMPAPKPPSTRPYNPPPAPPPTKSGGRPRSSLPVVRPPADPMKPGTRGSGSFPKPAPGPSPKAPPPPPPPPKAYKPPAPSPANPSYVKNTGIQGAKAL